MKEKLKGVASKIVNGMLTKDPREWPPECTFLIYQPVRPIEKNINERTNQCEVSTKGRH